MDDETNKKTENPLYTPDGKLLKAAAIRYDKNEVAPHVVARGKGYIADKILQKAKDENVPVHRDPALAEELTKMDLGEMIPPELYEVVAQVLIFISDLDYIHGNETKNE